jgi:shikimate kinase
LKNIVLLGFMGTGKSAVGRRLSASLGYDFVDTDRVIEQQQKKTVAGIFADCGEAEFRRMESVVVRELSRQTRCVIATGGGVALNPDNLEHLRQRGILVALQARPEVILKRVEKRVGERPLLQDVDPLSRIQSLLTDRADCYRNVDLTVDTSDLSTEEVVRRIEQQVWAIEGHKNSG